MCALQSHCGPYSPDFEEHAVTSLRAAAEAQGQTRLFNTVQYECQGLSLNEVDFIEGVFLLEYSGCRHNRRTTINSVNLKCSALREYRLDQGAL